jgi:hypothetical protein
MSAVKQKAADPNAQREDLVDRLTHLAERKAKHNEKHRKLTTDHEEAERALADVRVRELTGELGVTAADVEKALLARDEARQALNAPDFADERRALDRAEKLLRRELAQLTRRHHEAFEAECSKLSDEAEKALADALVAVRAAAKVWDEARAAWARLASEQDGQSSMNALTPESIAFSGLQSFPVQIGLASKAKARPPERVLDDDEPIIG